MEHNDDPVPVATAFTGYRAVSAEGARIVLMSCLTCGATIMLDQAEPNDVAAIHRKWHEQNGGCPPHDFDLLRQCRHCGLGTVISPGGDQDNE